MISIRDKVVYVHIALEDFEADGKVFKQGQIVYVGSGNKRRCRGKGYRTDEHIRVWTKLKQVILVIGLTLEESLDYEQRLISKYWNNNLLNRKKTTGTNRDYLYKFFDNVFYLDDNFELRWKCNKTINGKIIQRIGNIAGSNSGKYLSVNYQHRHYRVHRIIWCLYNKQDALGDKVIDHIDRNSFNNHPSNLRLVNYYENSMNRKMKDGILGEKFIHYVESRSTYVVKVKQGNNFSFKVGYFSFKSLIKLGYTEDEAKQSALDQAIEYRDSLLLLI